MTGEPLALTPQGVVNWGDTLRVLAFSGRLTYGDQTDKRYQDLCRCLEEGARTFVFDLSAVPDLDSAGISFLVMCLTTVRRAEGQLRLAAPSNRVLYALLITRLDTVFQIFDSVKAAVTAQPG